MGFISDIADRGKAEILRWAGGSDEDVPLDTMMKALEGTGLAEPTEETPRAMFHDPYSVQDWGGWRQRPSSLTYESLRQMAVQNTVIASIIQLRTHQVSQFCRPQQGVYDRGYRVILRDRRDNKRSMTKQEQKLASGIEAMLETTGLLLDGERPSDRDSFRSFMRKSTRDILTYDSWCYEKIRDKAGRVSRFVCLPAETIRPAVVDFEHMAAEQMRDRVAYVQVYDNTIISEFGVDDLAWNIMNPRSDLRANGFGFAPTEQIIRLVTAWLYGFSYNQKFFTQGSAVKGVLNIKGSIPDRQLRAFRRMWYSMVSGVQNAWRTPILNSEDIQWISMHTNNRDMEFSAWMDWLTKMTCAVYGIDPVEINFIFGNTGQSASLGQARPNADELTESKDKGLRPLTDFITDSINQHIVWEAAPELEFTFAGLDAKAEGKERERRTTEVKSYRTVDEIRAEMDLDPLPDDLGAAILDPTWLQFANNKQMMEQQQAQGGQPGAPGAAGEESGDGGEGGPPGGEEPSDEVPEMKLSLDLADATRTIERLRKGTRSETIAAGKRTIELDF